MQQRHKRWTFIPLLIIQQLLMHLSNGTTCVLSSHTHLHIPQHFVIVTSAVRHTHRPRAQERNEAKQSKAINNKDKKAKLKMMPEFSWKRLLRLTKKKNRICARDKRRERETEWAQAIKYIITQKICRFFNYRFGNRFLRWIIY